MDDCELGANRYLSMPEARNMLFAVLSSSDRDIDSRQRHRWIRTCCQALTKALSEGYIKAFYVGHDGSVTTVPCCAWAWDNEFGDVQFIPDENMSSDLRESMPVHKDGIRPMLEWSGYEQWQENACSCTAMKIKDLLAELAAANPDLGLGDLYSGLRATIKDGALFEFLYTDKATIALPNGFRLAIHGWAKHPLPDLLADWRRHFNGQNADEVSNWGDERLLNATLSLEVAEELLPVRRMLVEHAMTREQVIALCDRQGWPLPGMLRNALQTIAKPTALRDQRNIARTLANLIVKECKRRGRQLSTRDIVRVIQAIGAPWVSRDGFADEISKRVPQEWKKPGRSGLPRLTADEQAEVARLLKAHIAEGKTHLPESA